MRELREKGDKGSDREVFKSFEKIERVGWREKSFERIERVGWREKLDCCA